MEIVLYPHESLKRVAKAISFDYIHSEAFKRRVNRMFTAMYRRNGVGLAGPQAGWNRRIIVGNLSGRPYHDRDAFVLINPAIICSGPLISGEEGCLSMPGIYAPIERYEFTKVKTMTFEGEEKEIEASGFFSRVIQHEYDHLEGILFTDRMSEETLASIKEKIDEHVEKVTKKRKERDEKLKALEIKSRELEIEKRKKRKKLLAKYSKLFKKKRVTEEQLKDFLKGKVDRKKKRRKRRRK